MAAGAAVMLTGYGMLNAGAADRALGIDSAAASFHSVVAPIIRASLVELGLLPEPEAVDDRDISEIETNSRTFAEDVLSTN